jgi:NTE family protein
MTTALVLSAGGMFAAWELGAWKVLSRRVEPALIVGASAGAWLGWAIAGGVPLEEIERQWLDPSTGAIMQLGLHSTGILRPAALHEKARELFARSRPRTPFGLTLVEVPSLRLRLVRDREITWRHLAATCSIPFCFPPVEIDGRRYVDGGFRGSLPLWAAQRMGATRAIALHVLTGLPFRMLHAVLGEKRPGPPFETIRLAPASPLGSVRDSYLWREAAIRRWIALGERDANLALPSVTM